MKNIGKKLLSGVLGALVTFSVGGSIIPSASAEIGHVFRGNYTKPESMEKDWQLYCQYVNEGIKDFLEKQVVIIDGDTKEYVKFKQMKQNEKMRNALVFDMHGMTQDDATELFQFVCNHQEDICRECGILVSDIWFITGQGNHSPDYVPKLKALFNSFGVAIKQTLQTECMQYRCTVAGAEIYNRGMLYYRVLPRTKEEIENCIALAQDFVPKENERLRVKNMIKDRGAHDALLDEIRHDVVRLSRNDERYRTYRGIKDSYYRHLESLKARLSDVKGSTNYQGFCNNEDLIKKTVKKYKKVIRRKAKLERLCGHATK